MAEAGLFYRLTAFSMRRTRTQAFGFYLAGLFYAFLLVLLGGIAGAAARPDAAGEGFAAGCHAGAVFAATFCAVTAFLIVRRKRLGAGHYAYVAVTAASAVLAGPVAGMIVPACLTALASGAAFNQQLPSVEDAKREPLEKEIV